MTIEERIELQKRYMNGKKPTKSIDSYKSDGSALDDYLIAKAKVKEKILEEQYRKKSETAAAAALEKTIEKALDDLLKKFK